MGFLGDLVDDAFSLPGKVIGGAAGATEDVLARSLCLPVDLVRAAMRAGCKTKAEIECFVKRLSEE